LKLKAEASEYPDWVQCPEEEDRYVHEFNVSEDIQLDRMQYDLTLPSKV
jgi:hypothetical protein